MRKIKDASKDFSKNKKLQYAKWLKDLNKILEWTRLIHNFKPLEDKLDYAALKRISGNPEQINDDTAQELTTQFVSMLN